MAKMNPLERLGTPQDIAAVAFLRRSPTTPGSTARRSAPMAEINLI